MRNSLWLSLLLAVGLGIAGYLVGKGNQQPQPPAPPPPAPAPEAFACVANAKLTYDGERNRLTIDQKPYPVTRPKLDASTSAICWSFELLYPQIAVDFETLKIKVHVPGGRSGRPILVGDPDFRGGAAKVVWVRFEDEPNWEDVDDQGQRYRGVRVEYDIVAKPRNGPPINVDPYMIIKDGN